MTALNADTGKTGAKRQSWRRANPRDVLKRLIDSNPDATEDELHQECWSVLKKNEEQMRTVFEYWFANNYRSLINPASRPATKRAENKKKTDAFAEAISQQIGQKIDAKVKIALLEMMLPTGKPLRNSTREELSRLGGWAAAVAEKLQPEQTVAEAGITEEQLRELYR